VMRIAYVVLCQRGMGEDNFKIDIGHINCYLLQE